MKLSARQLRTARSATSPPPLSTRRSASRRSGGGLFTCRTCGATFTAYATAERHIDQAHHAGRLEWEDRCDAPNAVTPSEKAKAASST